MTDDAKLIERLQALILRARLIVPEYYLNWHAEARAARINEPQEGESHD